MNFRTQKIFFANNIKFLRERKKISQEALAKKLGITRAKLASIEAGNTRSPQPEDYLNFSDFFTISIDSLLKIDLSKLGELRLRELEAGNDVFIQGGNLRVLAISVDKDNNEQVEYVPIKAKAGYAAHYADPEFIATLPKYSLPNLPSGGTYRIFPITGDSMLPVPDGSDITGRFVTDWSLIKSETPCIVILKANQDVVFKLVSLQENGTFLLKSLNPQYLPYEIHSTDILEIWQFHAFTTKELPQQAPDMATILSAIRQLEKKIKEKNNDGPA